jgi:hypothetical protein
VRACARARVLVYVCACLCVRARVVCVCMFALLLCQLACAYACACTCCMRCVHARLPAGWCPHARKLAFDCLHASIRMLVFEVCLHENVCHRMCVLEVCLECWHSRSASCGMVVSLHTVCVAIRGCVMCVMFVSLPHQVHVRHLYMHLHMRVKSEHMRM